MKKDFTYFKRQIWHAILNRCREGYADLKITRYEWIVFCNKNRSLIEEHYSRGETPSVDRINSDGPYSIDNIQIKERWENVRGSRRRPARAVEAKNDLETRTFTSIKEAAEFVGGHKSNICSSIKTGVKSAGYFWRYL